MTEVSELQRREFDAAGDVLARAFYDMEQWRRTVPDDGIRLDKLRQMFVGTFKTTVAAKGVVEKTAGVEAAAIWLPPGRSMGLWPMVRSGFASARFVYSRPRLPLREITRTLLQFEKEHKTHMPDPHWYLMALGVDPDHQGHGFGSALVRHGVDRANEAGMRAYLETESGPNVGFYTGLGFEVLDEVVIEQLDLSFALMATPGTNQELPR